LEKLNFINKFEKQLDRVKNDQSKQLDQAEERLVEFKDYVETLKNENKNLLETQNLLLKRLNDAKNHSKSVIEELKIAKEENTALAMNMKHINEKMMMLMKEQNIGSEASSDLGFSSYSSKINQF